MLILDTDVLSFLEYASMNPRAKHLMDRLEEKRKHERVVTSIISYEEKMRGWMSSLSKKDTVSAWAEGDPLGQPMKVSIIGGGGLVGSMTAYALQCGGVDSSICIVDANKDMAEGQALDLLHGASLVADQRIYAGDMSDVASSNIVVITAGLRR